MNINKEISVIKKCLVEMDSCKNAERFYELCTTLYFHINSVVFNFQHYNFNIDKVDTEISTNENFNRFLKGDREDVSNN